MSGSLLLLEDDEALHRGIRFTLEQEGFRVTGAHTVSEARQALQDGAFDLLLLDVQLPDGNGFDFCAEVRRQYDLPIIFLTASDQEIDIVRGLDSGGDDYITKPFRLKEFLSRVHAVLRRRLPAAGPTKGTDPSDVLRSGPLTLHLGEMRLRREDADIPLTLTEFRLLRLFMTHPRAVLSKDQIIRHVWPDGVDALDDNTVAVNVARLREKLESDPQQPRHIETVRGAGYRWNG